MRLQLVLVVAFLAGACSDTAVEPSLPGSLRAAATAPARVYQAVDLAPIRWPIAINASGQILGSCDGGPPGVSTCLWDHGHVTYLVGVSVPVIFRMTDVLNDRGQVVGYCSSGGQGMCVWSHGAVTVLGTLGGASMPMAINPKGEVAGWSETSTGNRHAFVWERGVLTDLGTLGGTASEANAINSAGQVVGWSGTTTGDTHAFLWQKGVMQDLDTLPGYPNSEAYQINAAGVVVGLAHATDGETHVVLWAHDTVIDLGEQHSAIMELDRPLQITARGQVFETGGWVWYRGTSTPLSSDSRVLEVAAVNPAAVVVGIDWAASPSARAIVWVRGVVTDLPKLGTLAGENWATAINPGGQVVGVDWTVEDNAHGVLWTR